jgi:hypothetical protein
MFRHKVGRILAAALVMGAFGVLGSTSAHAGSPPPIDVSADRVVCNTVVGTATYATPLASGGPTSGPNLVTLKATLDGCVDTNNSNVHLAASTLKGTFQTSNGTNCSGLLGTTSTTASSIKVTWKAITGTPKLVVGSAPASSSITLSAVTGGLYTSDPWGGTYGQFSVAAGQATVTGAFTGGHGGAASTFAATSGQDSGALGNACTGKGLKTINFGIGNVAFG